MFWGPYYVCYVVLLKLFRLLRVANIFLEGLMLVTLLYMLVTLTADRNTRQQCQLPIFQHLKALTQCKS
jgi:hypothetical protein